MKYQKIMALALSACMMLACTSALGEGIIGSISGVKEGYNLHSLARVSRMEPGRIEFVD